MHIEVCKDEMIYLGFARNVSENKVGNAQRRSNNGEILIIVKSGY